MYTSILGRLLMANASGGWIRSTIDSTSFCCILVGVEEGARSQAHLGPTMPWQIWLSAFVIGVVLSFVGDKGPKLWHLLTKHLGGSGHLSAVLAENAAQKKEITEKIESTAAEHDKQKKKEVAEVTAKLEEALKAAKREYWLTVFTVQEIKVDLAVDPKIIYKNKLIIVLTNQTGREVHVWTPIWESKDVFAQQPFASKLRKEQVSTGGWKSGQWEDEEQCITLPAGQTVMCWIGLNEPPGDGLKERIKKQTTGTAIFPVKIDGKLYDAPIKA